MNVGMVLVAGFPYDIRVAKEADALIQGGHDVFLLCIQRSASEPSRENINGIRVQRFCLRSSKLQHAAGMLGWLVHRVGYTNPLWQAELSRFVERNRIDVLHLHDLQLARDVRFVARRMGIHYILDLHENYPYSIARTKKEALPWWIPGSMYDLDRWLRYEAIECYHAHRIVVVCREMGERLVQRHGIPTEKVHIVENTVDLDGFDELPLHEDILQRFQGRYVIGYVGSCSLHRGVDTIIRAIPLVSQRIPNVLLLVVGDGPGLQEWKKLSTNLGVYPQQVAFEGYQPFSKVRSFIMASSVCTVPHEADDQNNNGVPHKLYQYMACARPVLVSDCRSLKRIV
ncbi:MAG: glycosyltransferase family 4 protein, partial [Armatimonadota bacterium]